MDHFFNKVVGINNKIHYLYEAVDNIFEQAVGISLTKSKLLPFHRNQLRLPPPAKITTINFTNTSTTITTTGKL